MNENGSWFSTSMRKKIFAAVLGLVIILMLAFLRTDAWGNFKLASVRLWGFFTIQNNPLLENYDADLKTFRESETEPRVSKSLLLSGGPPKDGIPSLDNPQFVSAEETKFLDDEIVIGLEIFGDARAYPYGILNWHEVVNDEVGGVPVAVTLCPLCDTIPVFIREVNGEVTTFGVSGKLFQSCLVMYDRLTDSLWSQPWGIAIAGDQTNQSLERVVAHKTTLGQWKEIHPDTLVLSDQTGFRRDYFRYPYGSYYTDDRLIFPARNQESREATAKAIESYVWQPDEHTPQNEFSGEAFKFTHSDLRDIEEQSFIFSGEEIAAKWDENLSTIRFFPKSGGELASSTAFGFVWPAFFSGTD
jgi:hypothetical protein